MLHFSVSILNPLSTVFEDEGYLSRALSVGLFSLKLVVDEKKMLMR